jgi:hypothetical protein
MRIGERSGMLFALLWVVFGNSGGSRRKSRGPWAVANVWKLGVADSGRRAVTVLGETKPEALGPKENVIDGSM